MHRSAIGGDQLDIDRDVRSLAELICLKDATPPLSIGLFGNWGSGKTFFMQAMQREIRNINEEARNRHQTQDKSKNADANLPWPFVADVVQVRFNAWHYADAELWASLTSEFFEQLRAGGAENAMDRNYGRLVDRVSAHISKLRADLAVKQEQAAQLEHRVATAELERDKISAAAARERSGVINEVVKAELSKAFAENREHLRELGQHVDHDDLPKEIQSFIRVVQDASTLAGEIKLIARVVTRSGFASRCAIVVVALFAAVLPTVTLFWDSSAIARILTSIYALPLWSALVIMVPAASHGIKIVRRISKRTADFAKQLAEMQDTATKSLAEKEAALDILNRQTEKAQDAANDARKALAMYSKDGTTAAQPALLRYLLDEDPDTREHEKHLGLISRVRRSFETLDALLKNQAKMNAKNETGDHSVPDRIVLYIDDLDRCRNEQVVRVLEAVHLLLAFESIVVVVGVDARWVRNALAKYYQGEFAAEPPPQSAEASKNGRADAGLATPEDYLEKIFQIPFWLKPFREQSATTYRNYVRSLARPQGAVPSSSQSQPIVTDFGDGQIQAKGEVSMQEQERTLQPGSTSASETATERVTLSDDEITVLTTLAPVAGTTPRAIKRFINLYRLIRARRRNADFDRFVGQGGEAADYPAVAFLLAIETGQTSTMIERIHRLVDDTGSGTLWSALENAKRKGMPSPNQEPIANAQAASISRTLNIAPEIEAAINRLRELKIPNVSITKLRDVLDEVKRYSFHYH
jgi:hypothetical protein